MFLLLFLAVLAIVAFGIGFSIHWLFAVSVVLALVWVISFIASGAGDQAQGTWQ